MPSFVYGSRVIENERQVKFQRNVRKIGNLLHAVVSFFVTFFLFILINFLLRNLVQNANLTFDKMLNFVQQNAEFLLSHSALSVVSFIYQHSLCFMLAVAFTCVYKLGVMLTSLVGTGSNFDKQKQSYNKDSQQFNTQTAFSTISYRHKVCFLS